jgi:hypothetical protein
MSVTLRRYVVRDPKRHDFAEIVIGDNGFLAIVSSYENWAYAWRNHGRADFRDFLLGMDVEYPDYLGGKLDPVRVFDADETTNRLLDLIERSRRDGGMSVDAAEEAEEDAHSIASEDEWRDWIDRHGASFDTCEAHGTYAQQLNPQVVGFIKHMWPLFCEQLRAELAGQPVAERAP